MSAPNVGLKPTAPQKLAGRKVEPTTWVPSAAGTTPAPTAAAEPLLEPPGVRLGSCGLVVGALVKDAANSVVVVLPRMIAPASRSACTRGGVALGLEPLPLRRALARRHVGGLDDVLDGDHHAVDRRERLAVAPALVGRLRRRACRIARDVDEGLQRGFDGIEARKPRLEFLGGAGVAALEASGERQVRRRTRHFHVHSRLRFQFTVSAAAFSLS